MIADDFDAAALLLLILVAAFVGARILFDLVVGIARFLERP